MGNKVELLSPAGNYEAFLGALHAGADAVYLSGEKFGARAYADNFTAGELCRALWYAHLYGRKIYLTVNTLVKETEFDELYDYLSPLYEAGLDGIIVQDLGVFSYVKKQFPELAMHISTQMTVTGAEGADFLKKLGADRIVPARELDLQEILQIKRQTGIEMECFIHGAMCYSYSGQCLFSSVLGDRSGNRGRCAQPCRLPYQVVLEEEWNGKKINCNNNARYPISLKDMCTIEYLPGLMDAGIDSFKIEGRMKKPEYTAAVTALYRKYIDLYREKGQSGYKVAEEDLEILKKLYIRSEIQNGYYERHNGREMITLQDPSYQESDEALLGKIRKNCIFKEQKFPVTLSGHFAVNEPAVVCLTGEGVTVKVRGNIVEPAVKRPMGRDEILKQLRKTGNTHVNITVNITEDSASAEEELSAKDDFVVEEGIFVPVGQLNELRRNAARAWEKKRINEFGCISERNRVEKIAEEISGEAIGEGLISTNRCKNKKSISGLSKAALHASVCTMEQLKALADSACERIYLDSEFFLAGRGQIVQIMEKSQDKQWFLALPYMMRTPELTFLENLTGMSSKEYHFAGQLSTEQLPPQITGILVRNLEELAWFIRNFRGQERPLDIVADAGFYCFNSHTLSFLENFVQECTLPYELNAGEYRQLMRKYEKSANMREKALSVSMIVYGTIPMMVSANCLLKTTENCKADGKKHLVYLKDRYQNCFPVWCHCMNCHNVIYNTLPLSLHHYWKELKKLKANAWRLDFLSESGVTARKIVDYFAGLHTEFPTEKHTAGHYKRGVE